MKLKSVKIGSDSISKLPKSKALKARSVLKDSNMDFLPNLIKQGKFIDKNAKVGEFIYDPLPPIDFGRVSAQAAKQVIVQKVKEADKERQYLEFKDKTDTLMKNLEVDETLGQLLVAEGFSTIEEISIPIFSFLIISWKLFLDFSSIDKGETANGNGFKFPLVISTSIKAKALIGIKAIKNNIIKFFFISLS